LLKLSFPAEQHSEFHEIDPHHPVFAYPVGALAVDARIVPASGACEYCELPCRRCYSDETLGGGPTGYFDMWQRIDRQREITKEAIDYGKGHRGY
jgi:hypothetical protein